MATKDMSAKVTDERLRAAMDSTVRMIEEMVRMLSMARQDVDSDLIPYQFCDLVKSVRACRDALSDEGILDYLALVHERQPVVLCDATGAPAIDVWGPCHTKNAYAATLGFLNDLILAAEPTAIFDEDTPVSAVLDCDDLSSAPEWFSPEEWQEVFHAVRVHPINKVSFRLLETSVRSEFKQIQISDGESDDDPPDVIPPEFQSRGVTFTEAIRAYSEFDDMTVDKARRALRADIEEGRTPGMIKSRQRVVLDVRRIPKDRRARFAPK